MRQFFLANAITAALLFFSCGGKDEPAPPPSDPSFFALSEGNRWEYSCDCPSIGASDAEIRIDEIDEKNFPQEKAYVWVLSFQGLSPVKRWLSTRSAGLYLLQEEGRGILAEGLRRFDPPVLLIKTPLTGAQSYQTESSVGEDKPQEVHRFDVVPDVEVTTEAGVFETFQLVQSLTAGEDRKTIKWNFAPRIGFVQIVLPEGDTLKLKSSSVLSAGKDGGP